MEEIELSDFEKVCILAAAQLNSPKELSNGGYNEEDLQKICTYAQFKSENAKMFSGKLKEPSQDDQNYYMIPVTVKAPYRIGDKKIDEQKAYLLTDNNGYGLFVFTMESKQIYPANSLAKQRDIAYWRYRNLIDKGEITQEEIDEAFNEITNIQNIDDITKMIEQGQFDLDHIQSLIDKKIEEHSIELSQTPEENENEIVDCNEMSEEEVDEKSERMGVTREALESLTKKHECTIDQISYRKVEDYQRLSDDIGLTIQETRGRQLLAVRINYPSKQKYYLVDVQTGEHLRPRNEMQYEDLPELEDYFKFHQQRESGEDYAVPIGYEMASETQYPEMTAIDDAGEVIEKRFVNNGRAEDMIKSQRERYLAEVEEKNQELSEKIKIYEAEATPENWRAVNDAIRERIMVDKKYSVLENQKNLTIESLENTVDLIHEKNKDREKEFERTIDDDDYDQYGRLIPGH